MVDALSGDEIEEELCLPRGHKVGKRDQFLLGLGLVPQLAKFQRGDVLELFVDFSRVVKVELTGASFRQLPPCNHDKSGEEKEKQKRKSRKKKERLTVHKLDRKENPNDTTGIGADMLRQASGQCRENGRGAAVLPEASNKLYQPAFRLSQLRDVGVRVDAVVGKEPFTPGGIILGMGVDVDARDVGDEAMGRVGIKRQVLLRIEWF